MEGTYETLLNAVKENGGHIDFIAPVEVHPFREKGPVKAEGITYSEGGDRLFVESGGRGFPVDELPEGDETGLLDEIAWEEYG